MNELFEYPFRSGVWGTAADWSIFAVTALTLWFLVRTLKSQLAVQKLQLKVTRIENERFRKENCPEFSVNFIGDYNKDSEPHKGYYQARVVILFELKNCFCRNVEIELASENSEIKEFNKFSLIKEFMKEGQKEDILLSVKIPDSIFEKEGAFIKGYLSFDDPVDNWYQQEFNITLTSFSTYVKDFPPELRTT